MPIRSEMSLRVPTPLWYSEEQFVEFFQTMRRLAAFEEYALFTHDCHTPPLAEMLRRAAVLRERIAKMREIAPCIGINHLCTLGHADEDLVWAKSNPGRLGYSCSDQHQLRCPHPDSNNS